MQPANITTNPPPTPDLTRKADDITASPQRRPPPLNDDDMDIDTTERPPPSTHPSALRKSKSPRTLNDMWSLVSLGSTRSSLKRTPPAVTPNFTLNDGISFAIDTNPIQPNNNERTSQPSLSNVSLRRSTRNSSSTAMSPAEFINSIIPPGTPNDTTTESTVTGLSSITATPRRSPHTSATSAARSIPTTWQHTMIIEVTVKVPKAGGSPFNTFRDRLFAGLDFLHLHGEDLTIAFLPKDTPDSATKPPMLSTADFPTVQCTMKRHYFSFPNPFAFSTVNNEKGRKILFSSRMGFNVNPDLFLDEMSGDLEERHCAFKRKTQQAMDVETAVVLWGAPQFMCPRDGKEIIDGHLIPLEKDMMKEDPQSFPTAVHNQPWPEYELSLEQPADFERTPQGEKWVPKPPSRRAVHIKCAKSDIDRLVILVAAAKSKRTWLDEFGKCFPSETMTKKMWEEDEDSYNNVLSYHMAIIYSYSKSYVPGLLRAREEFKVTCLPDASGKVVTHTVSIRSILQDVDLGGKKVFQCVLRSDGNRRYQVYYKSKCPITTAFVREYMKCPAAQVYYYLIKRGVKRSEVDRLVKKSFSHDQIALVKPAKYNKATKLAQVTIAEEDMDIVMAAQQSEGFIDTLGNLSEKELLAWKAKQTRLLTDASRSDPAAYDFENGQSVTSIHAGKNHPQFGSGASIGASKYSVVTEAHPDLQLDDDDTEDMAAYSSGTVSFAMEREDGTVDDVLRLPENRTRTTENEENEEAYPVAAKAHGKEDGDEAMNDMEVDDNLDNTLAFQLWMVAPDDLHSLELLIDQLELELYAYEDIVESAPGFAARITPSMRAAMHREAAEAKMDLFEYLHDLRTALYKTHGKGGEEEYDDEEDDADTEEAQDSSFSLKDYVEDDDHDTTLRLPGQGMNHEQDYGADSTGLPQGSGSNNPPGGISRSLSTAVSAAGAETVTALPGGFPG